MLFSGKRDSVPGNAFLPKNPDRTYPDDNFSLVCASHTLLWIFPFLLLCALSPIFLLESVRESPHIAENRNTSSAHQENPHRKRQMLCDCYGENSCTDNPEGPSFASPFPEKDRLLKVPKRKSCQKTFHLSKKRFWRFGDKTELRTLSKKKPSLTKSLAQKSLHPLSTDANDTHLPDENPLPAHPSSPHFFISSPRPNIPSAHPLPPLCPITPLRHYVSPQQSFFLSKKNFALILPNLPFHPGKKSMPILPERTPFSANTRE